MSLSGSTTYPQDIRKAIYTTNAIESLNRLMIEFEERLTDYI